MMTVRCWVIARPDGQAFCGLKAGVAQFTSDHFRQRCYSKKSVALNVIKAYRLTDCAPVEIDRQRPD